MQNTATGLINRIISENVKTLIGGFSQSLLKAAAAKTGVSARTIAYMISAEDSNPRLDTLAKFARGYRVELTALLKKDFGNSPYPAQEPPSHVCWIWRRPAASISSSGSSPSSLFWSRFSGFLAS